MFQLSRKEFDDLRSQVVTSSSWGGRRTPPYAFTEQGVAMLSSVLTSARAVEVNVQIMREFVRLRELVAEHSDLARRVEELESRYDAQFRTVFQAILALISEDTKPRRRIGFRADDKHDKHQARQTKSHLRSQSVISRCRRLVQLHKVRRDLRGIRGGHIVPSSA